MARDHELDELSDHQRLMHPTATHRRRPGSVSYRPTAVQLRSGSCRDMTGGLSGTFHERSGPGRWPKNSQNSRVCKAGVARTRTSIGACSVALPGQQQRYTSRRESSSARFSYPARPSSSQSPTDPSRSRCPPVQDPDRAIPRTATHRASRSATSQGQDMKPPLQYEPVVLAAVEILRCVRGATARPSVEWIEDHFSQIRIQRITWGPRSERARQRAQCSNAQRNERA